LEIFSPDKIKNLSSLEGDLKIMEQRLVDFVLLEKTTTINSKSGGNVKLSTALQKKDLVVVLSDIQPKSGTNILKELDKIYPKLAGLLDSICKCKGVNVWNLYFKTPGAA
jgi:hypothetical protein